MQEKDKLIRVFVAGAFMLLAIFFSIGIKDKKSHQSTSTTETTAMQEEREENEIETEETTEAMTEAPHDTSDWEMQEPDNTEPDTGARIEE